jgi:hypothetical protein
MEVQKKKSKSAREEFCLDIAELKGEYDKYKEKYNLPEFYELNKLFDIEEIDIQTEFLLRKIRRLVSERIAGYMRFIEIILNPSNAPMFFFKLIKKLDSHDREILTNVYESLGHFEIEIITLDLNYSEEKEAEFINKAYKTFNEESRVKLLEVVKKLENENSSFKKEINGSYFG